MAYVALIGEGAEAEVVMNAALEARQDRVTVLAQRPGACVLYDTNMARECIRDVKERMGSGKLFVFRLEEPQEVFAPGKGETV